MGSKATCTIVKKAPTKTPRGRNAQEKPRHKFEDELIAVAERLIIKGKEEGCLAPDDILQALYP